MQTFTLYIDNHKPSSAFHKGNTSSICLESLIDQRVGNRLIFSANLESIISEPFKNCKCGYFALTPSLSGK